MSLLPSNVLVVYRTGDADSLEFAQYYAAIHGISDAQLLGVPCSGNEILDSYSTFVTEIEQPVINFISSDEYLSVSCIVVGYGVPGGFQDGSTVISTTSRLSRLYDTFVGPVDNPLFSRQLLQDNENFPILIVSRFDSPSLEVSKSHVDNCSSVFRSGGYANGTFYFDKISLDEYSGSTGYYDDLTDFELNTLPVLNMPTFSTVADNVNDVPLFRLLTDSFVWAWASDRAGYSYFEQNQYNRIFCYNADTDGAAEVRDANDRRWPMLAMSSGYASCAGPVSDDAEPDDYLRPRAFFEALLGGFTVGEAFYYATPRLDNSMTLFGDPLVTVRFPTGATLNSTISELTGYLTMADGIASSIAYTMKNQSDLTAIQNIILSYTDFDVKVELSAAAQSLVVSASAGTINQYAAIVQALAQFPTPGIDTYLTENDVQVSRLLNLTLGVNVVSSANLLEEGSWAITIVLQRATVGFDYYSLYVEASLHPDFSSPFLTADSGNGDDGFTYEQSQDNFVVVPIAGVAASYAGYRARYTSQTNSTAGDVLYVRIRQYSQSEELAWVTQTLIVNT